MSTNHPIPIPEGQRQFIVNICNPAGNAKQLLLVRSPLKRKIVRAGRRFGKTSAAAILALEAFLKGKRVLYAAPVVKQVDQFWAEVKRALEEPILHKILYKHEGKHIIRGTPVEDNEVVQGKDGVPYIEARTAFNADTLRGGWCDLLILDEFQGMDHTALTEVGYPMLIDTNGDLVIIYTPPSLHSRSASKASDPQFAAKLFKEHKDDPRWLCIHGKSTDNPWLSKGGLEEVSYNMSNEAYRQEILAEDMEEIPGALWTRQIIENSRVTARYNNGALVTKDGQTIQLRRIVVAIDPSGGNTTEVGIVVGGEGENEHIYVLRDATMTAARPKDWAQCAIGLYSEYLADRIIAEKNYGGAMVEETLRNVDESVSYKAVDASRGKLVRAEPVLALFQQNKMHMVCTCGKQSNQCTEFQALEDELCTYTAEPGQKSPNRLDAMVWCGIELSGSGSLGLLDWLKSGKAEQFMGRSPVPMTPNLRRPAGVVSAAPNTGLGKVAGATSLAAVATSDKTPACPNCEQVTMQNIIAGGQVRCNHCSHQYWQDGTKPQAQLPLGGRKITLQK